VAHLNVSGLLFEGLNKLSDDDVAECLAAYDIVCLTETHQCKLLDSNDTDLDLDTHNYFYLQKPAIKLASAGRGMGGFLVRVSKQLEGSLKPVTHPKLIL